MHNYTQRQQAKKAYYADKARKLRTEAASRYERGTNALRVIPFGQPILVGHHSEQRDRRYREWAGAQIDTAIELERKADYYARKADTLGTGGISADDPAAVTKLTKRLAQLEHAHERMKAWNKEARAKGERAPFPSWALANNGANIRRVAERIRDLEARARMEEAAPVRGDGWMLTEEGDENRILLAFERKPSEEVRAALKAQGFRWSPSRVAWVRQRSEAGRAAAQTIVSKLSA